MKVQLGFGDREFAVNTEAGLVYDPDETDNLEKKLADLGMYTTDDVSPHDANVLFQVSSKIALSLS